MRSPLEVNVSFSVGATKFRSFGETDNAYCDSVNRDKNESNATTKPLAAAAVCGIQQSFGLIRIDTCTYVLLYKSFCAVMTWMRTMTLRLTRTCSNYNHHWQQRRRHQQQLQQQCQWQTNGGNSNRYTLTPLTVPLISLFIHLIITGSILVKNSV